MLGVCSAFACAVVLSQACGSEDAKSKVLRAVAGQGGEGASGETSSGAPGGGTAGDGGALGGAPAGNAGAPAGNAGAPAGNAGEGATGPGGQGGQGGQGGVPGEAGLGGQAGTSGEAGAGGADNVTCELASTCSGTLAQIGTGDFSIAFTITTSTTARSGIISQRAICMHSKFWDIQLGTLAAGVANLSVQLDDQSNFTAFGAPATLNDGQPHEVRVCRKAGQVYAFSDGVLIGQAASAVSFSTLPALTTLTTTCTPYDSTVNLDGTVTGVCVGAL